MHGSEAVELPEILSLDCTFLAEEGTGGLCWGGPRG